MRAVNPNPYDSATASDADEVVDRAQRDGLADTIGQFLSEQSTAFEFDEASDDYRESIDPTVRFVTHAVWYHYDASAYSAPRQMFPMTDTQTALTPQHDH